MKAQPTYQKFESKPPQFSEVGKAKSSLGIALPAWQEGLDACMNNKYAH